jgi:filamentous hemagglutinin
VLKKFRNLFPEDSPILVQRSRLIWKQEKWLEVTYTGEERTASGVYNFVTLESRCFIRKASAKVADRSIGHIDLAMGREVDYAGRIYFSGRNKRGIIRKWTNESGHYRPDAEYMSNAGLPVELFEAGQFQGLISPIL